MEAMQDESTRATNNINLDPELSDLQSPFPRSNQKHNIQVDPTITLHLNFALCPGSKVLGVDRGEKLEG